MYIRKTEMYINPYEECWEYRYYKSLFNIDIDDNRKKQICTNYLSILEWNYYYYNNKCMDWRFKYNYAYPPLFMDLLKYIPVFHTNFIEEKKKNPIDENIQLAYVLPRNSLSLLPIKHMNKLLDKLNNYYQLDYDFEWAFCKYFWECHVKVKDLNIEELEKLLK